MKSLGLSSAVLMLLLAACDRTVVLDESTMGLLVGPSPAMGAAPLPVGANLDQPLSVLFAPDDPTLSLELSLIDRVVQARQADARTFVTAMNPYRIRYSVINISHEAILTRLIDAKEKGVVVQLQIDARYLNVTAAREINLAAHGFNIVPDHRTLTDSTRASANFVGIIMTSGGLMHTKLRLFETPGSKWLLTGSMNPSTEAQSNEETLHLIRDPRLIAAYAAAYESIQRGQRPANAWTDGAAVNVLFAPAGSGPMPGRRVLDWIAAENDLILLMVFSLRDFTAPGFGKSLVQLLKDKATAGVPVWVITDRKQADGVDVSGKSISGNDLTDESLSAAGVHVYKVLNTAGVYTAMHSKVAILGRARQKLITDSANFSLKALGSATTAPSNYESVLFIDSSALDSGLTGRRYLAQWLKVLSRWADQSAAAGEPAYVEVLRRLATTGAWPEQSINFTALQAYTSFGEEVRVLGSLGPLGVWGTVGTGSLLHTDAMAYPTWRSVTSVAFPLGSWFEWKLAAGWGTGAATRWELGENRLTFAQPTPLVPNPTVELQAQWR